MSTYPITLPKKLKIAYLAGQGLSHRSIARELEVSHTTVNRLIQMIHSAPLEERPRKVRDERRQILQLFILFETLLNRSLSSRNLARKCELVLGVRCSKSTVCRIRASVGLAYRWSRKRQRLTAAQQYTRNMFCFLIQMKTEWTLPWAFSDESMIIMNPDRSKIWTFPGELSDAIFENFKGYPTKVMVWGCIAKDFKSPLIWVQGRITAADYQAVLERSNVFPELDERFGRFSWVFQQDGASPHTAHTTREFLAQRCRTLPEDVHWPASSPDLNVIENLWGIEKRKISMPLADTPEQLFMEAERVWNAIPMEHINHLVESFPNRIQACQFLVGECLNGKDNVIRVIAEEGYDAALARRDQIIADRRIAEQELRAMEHWTETILDTRYANAVLEAKEIIQRFPPRFRDGISFL